MTTLEKLQAQRAALDAQASLTPVQLWLLQELVYRIGVFECCKAFQLSAPNTTDAAILGPHYKLVDAYIHHLAQERQFGKPADQAQQKQRETALASLNKVIGDYQRRFQSYRPGTPEQYAADIGRALQTALPAWMQHRNCYIDVKKEMEQQ
jgi:hypothetical protein